MSSTTGVSVNGVRKEVDSLGEVAVLSDKLWGAQTQRSLEHFSIGHDLMPREMIAAYVILKQGAANANHAAGRLDEDRYLLIVQACDEILDGEHEDMFPLHVWMTGSGTQFNMNVNEVISNRCCQLAGTPLGSKTPVHPNDHVNMSQSSNDSFPTAMNIAAAVNAKERLIPAVRALRDAISTKAEEWKDIAVLLAPSPPSIFARSTSFYPRGDRTMTISPTQCRENSQLLRSHSPLGPRRARLTGDVEKRTQSGQDLRPASQVWIISARNHVRRSV